MNFDMSAKVNGVFRVQLKDSNTGKIKQDTGEFSNAILNNVIDSQNNSVSGNKLQMVYAHFGTGSSATDLSSTTLQSPITPNAARVAPSLTVTTDLNIAANTFTIKERRVVTTLAGQFQGNLSEVGMGPSNLTSSTQVFSRALILDDAGNPVTITAGAEDQLVVTYDLYFTIPAQTINTINVITNGVSVPTTVTLAVQHTLVSGDGGIKSLDYYINTLPGRAASFCYAVGTGANFNAPGAQISNYTGKSAGIGTRTNEVITTDGSKRIATQSAGVTELNTPGGISILCLGGSATNPDYAHYAHLKAQFDPVIPKDNTRNMVYTMHFSIGR